MLRERLFWGKGIGGAFQVILRAGWPWTHFLGGSFSAISPPLQISCCLHRCFWRFCGSRNCLHFDFFSAWGLGSRENRVFSDVSGYGCSYLFWYEHWCETGSAFLAGEAVAGLSSVFFGEIFFFQVTSVQSSSFFWGRLGLTRLLFFGFAFAADGGCGDCYCCHNWDGCGSYGTVLGQLQKIYFLNASISTEESGQHLSWNESRDITECDLNLRVPKYSGCSQKYFVVMLLQATLAACSLEGSKTLRNFFCISTGMDACFPEQILEHLFFEAHQPPRF